MSKPWSARSATAFDVFVFVTSPGFGQQADGAGAPGKIGVTGPRIGTPDGYAALTPVTVVETERLQRGTPTYPADALNRPPRFQSARLGS